MNIVFAGTPAIAAEMLEHLLGADKRPIAVYTQPDRSQGRGRKLTPSPVKTLALEHNIAVEQPPNFKAPDVLNTLAHYAPTVMVVVAYGLILPQAVLDIPEAGCLNVHTSLLPRWRGAMPMERSFIAGDKQAGTCIMQMDAGLDTGPVHRRIEFPMPERFADLERQTIAASAEALVEVLDGLQAGTLGEPQAQSEEGVTYAHKLTAAERWIDWTKDAAAIARQIDALSYRAPARTKLDSKSLQLMQATPDQNGTSGEAGQIVAAGAEGIRVQCATHQLLITELKMEGRQQTSAQNAVNGYPQLFQPGQRLT